MGRNIPREEITEDWKKVLFNQFHDLAAGSGIGIIYKDAQKDYDVVRYSTNEINEHSFGSLVGRVDTSSTAGNQIPVVVINPLGWDRSGEVKFSLRLPSNPYEVVDASGGVIPSRITHNDNTAVTEIVVHVDHVPALGYKKILVQPVAAGAGNQIAPKAAEAEQTADSLTLDNGTLRVAVEQVIQGA